MFISVSQFTLKSTKPFRCGLFILEMRLSFPLEWRFLGELEAIYGGSIPIIELDRL
jgi:hypothetical protein